MSSQAMGSGVVVGVDGSPSSKRAIQWAAQEAKMRNVPLTLVHVVVTPAWGPAPWLLSTYPLPIPAEEDPDLRESGRAVIADAAKVVEETFPDGGGPKVASELFFSVPVSTLVDLSKESQMVVVGCRGQHSLQRILLGSVSIGLIHHAHCPVAVIHDAAHFGPGQASLPVLVGVDGSPASELATAIAFDEASWRGVDLVALHAWSDSDVSKVSSLEWAAQQAVPNKALAERLAGWRERYPDVIVHPRLVRADPARHLLEASEAAQLVIVGSHGRGGFAGMLLGSVSTAVTQAASVPVIVARQR